MSDNNKNKRVLVGLSGGVDSAVAALILKEKGYAVIGATMAIWGDRPIPKHSDKNKNAHSKNACFGPDEKEDIESAKKIAEQLGIEYHVYDCSSQYNDIVLSYFKKEYKNARTPNPCVFCNALVKFGVLPEVAKKNGLEFDKFATGHYARIVEKDGELFLKRGIAANKDQSYFLCRLDKNKLKDILLPLGDYTKDEIRAIARKAGLTVAGKKDSQDFYSGDYNELLNIEAKKGNIVDIDGNVLGSHEGVWNFTVGQRKGLNINTTVPYYVLSLNADKNEVVVGKLDKTFKNTLIASNINYLGKNEELPKKLTAKIRSGQQPTECTVEKIFDKENNSEKIKVTFENYQKSMTPGQSVVLYDEDDCIVLGAIIDSVQ